MHNKCCATAREFATAVLTFPREEARRNWTRPSNPAMDNFRVIGPEIFQVLA
jgi:hypothetical protein